VVTVEERVAFLEGRVGEHAQMLTGIREAIVDLEARMDRRFEAVDRRFQAVDGRFERLEHRLDALDAKFSRYLLWLVGLQVTTLAAMVAALASVISALSGR
jgi:uncharacterized coiled-coil protein SlyX